MEFKQKDEKAILSKLGIDALNPMQLKAREVISHHNEIVLLSDTGTGKT
ncbi:MAG: ATP-dependent helicase, partial [Saprospiraceae bacterium]|nr:ATP-dependent helicase [Saprospiraceae bacterium]